MPFDDLGERVVVTGPAHRQAVREDEATERVATLEPRVSSPSDEDHQPPKTYEISAVRVQLAAKVVGGEVQLRLVEEGNDLEVRRGDKELHAGDGTRGNETGAAAGLRAPCDLLALGVANGRRSSGRGPHAPV